jgi:translation initiation factor 2 subunit 3
MDVLIQSIEQIIPTPARPTGELPQMYIARSFDVNKPGTPIEDIKGGVIGGSLIRGKLRQGDKLEIRPGRMVTSGGKEKWLPIETEITSIMAGGEMLKEVTPGGLIGVGTKLDPSMTIEDSLAGQCVGLVGSLPPTRTELTVQFHLLARVVGVATEMQPTAIKVSESLMLSVGTAITMGEVKKVTKDTLNLKLSRPICAKEGALVAIGRKISARWHLIGAGEIVRTNHLKQIGATT